MPGAGGTQNLPRAVGERRAKEVILTGRPFDAQKAHEWGVLNEVFDAAELMTRGSRPRHRRQRAAVGAPGEEVDPLRHADGPEDRRIRFEVEAYNRLVGTEDRLEGVRAFNEKRKPEVQGPLKRPATRQDISDDHDSAR
jgi:enoyl-CoA hydratase